MSRYLKWGYAKCVPVSEVLATVLLERIRRLNHVERAVLTRASVIGRRFRLAVLAATSAQGEVRVRAILSKATMQQFVLREESRGDWYAFRHALIRDVAYQEFIDARVRSVHRLIARALERCAESDGATLDDLAYHSWAARDVARCTRYNELAGDAAAAVFAHCDAQTYYSRAREFVRPQSELYRRLTYKLSVLEGDG